MELQIMIVRGDLAAIAAKAGHLKGQIVRFEAEAYNDLEVHDRECLVIAREQVGLIVEQATAGRASPETKGRRIQAAHALAEEQLNRILGNRRAEIRRERLWPST